MSRNTLLWIPILLAMMLSYWYISSEMKQRKAVLLNHLQTESAATAPSLPRVTAGDQRAFPTSKPGREPTAAATNEITSLQQQLMQELQRLDDQRRTLESLRRQQQAGANPPNYGLRIQQAQAEIQNLSEVLQDYVQSENTLHGQVQQGLQEQDYAAKYQSDQIETAIQTLQHDQQETEKSLTYWRNYPGFDWDLQQRELPRLEALLTEQKAQLENLRAQRVALSQQTFLNVQSMFSVVDQARSELRNSALDAQTQVASLRNEIMNMQMAQEQAKEAQRALSARITQTERQMNEQQTRIRNLQDQISARE